MLPVPIVCLVTDRSVLRGKSLSEAVSMAVDGGVNMVQLREKDLAGGDLLRLALDLREVTRGRAILVVNDRVDVALAAEADGVHLGEAGLPVSVVRRLAGDRLLIGCSVHSVEAAVRAEAEGADYLIVGTVFATSSHPEVQPQGMGILRQVRERVGLPIVAIGGISAANAGECMAAGADGVAAISWLLGSADPCSASAALRKAMASAVGSRRFRDGRASSP